MRLSARVITSCCVHSRRIQDSYFKIETISLMDCRTVDGLGADAVIPTVDNPGTDGPTVSRQWTVTGLFFFF